MKMKFQSSGYINVQSNTHQSDPKGKAVATSFERVKKRTEPQIGKLPKKKRKLLSAA